MATTESRYTFSVSLVLSELGKENEKPMMESVLTYNGLKYANVVELEALIPNMVASMNQLGKTQVEQLKASPSGGR